MAVYQDDAYLEGLWELEEASGIRYDITHNCNHMTQSASAVGSSTDSQEGDRSAEFELANSEYLEISDANQSGLAFLEDFTLCCWVKPSSLTGTHCLIGKWVASGSQRSYMLALVNVAGTYYPRLYISDDGTTETTVTFGTAVTVDNWVHLAAVSDGANIYCYRNGSSDRAAYSYSDRVNDSTSPFMVGGQAAQYYTNGLIDEVAAFSRALSAAEINDVYTYTIQDPLVYETDPNLRGRWKLDEVGGVRYDSSPWDDNDLADNESVASSTDKMRGARSAEFEAGNGEYLSIANAAQTGLDLYEWFSILCWAKPETLDDVDGHVLVSKMDSGDDGSYRFWLIESSSSYYLSVSLSTDGSAYTEKTGATAITGGSWYHLAVVWNSVEVRLYIDGELELQSSYAGLLYDSDEPFCIGAISNEDQHWDGLIDDVQVFSRPLYQGEVRQIYETGLKRAARRVFVT